MAESADNGLSAAVAALARGEVVAYPTETFYGLAVDAANPVALAALVALKGRLPEKAISLVITADMLPLVAAEVPPLAARLARAFWPGPLTLVLPARPDLPARLVDDGCVAVRESPHPLARALAAGLGRPITATSANRAGEPPATTADDVRAAFPQGCLVLDGGRTAGGLPSTLVRVRGAEGQWEVLRPGVITREALAAVVSG